MAETKLMTTKKQKINGNSKYVIFVNKIEKNKIGETMALDLRHVESHRGVKSPLSISNVSRVTLSDGSIHTLMISPEKLGAEVASIGPRIYRKNKSMSQGGGN